MQRISFPSKYFRTREVCFNIILALDILDMLDILISKENYITKRHKSCFLHHPSGENNDNNVRVMCCSPRG